MPQAGREDDIAVVGRVRFRSRNDVFGIRTDDRRRHLAIIGKTGMGKTALLRQLIVSDMRRGRALALVDPHGDLADAILDQVPKHRTNETIAFDAGDRAFPLTFNPRRAAKLTSGRWSLPQTSLPSRSFMAKAGARGLSIS